MSLGKGRKCAETCLDLLQIELVNYYSEQKITPPQAAIDAIGEAFNLLGLPPSLETALAWEAPLCPLWPFQYFQSSQNFTELGLQGRGVR